MIFQENKYDHHEFREHIWLVDHFFGSTGSKTIHLHTGAELHYLAVLGAGATVDIIMETTGEGAKTAISVLIVPDRFQPATLRLESKLLHNDTHTQVHILTFLTDLTQAQVDGQVFIGPDISKAVGHLLEENIVLGEKIKINTLPMLDVQSNDVQASHGARIEKLDPKKLFYFKSRGLSDHDAKQLLISGYMETIFGPFVHQAVHDHIHPQLLALHQQYLHLILA